MLLSNVITELCGGMITSIEIFTHFIIFTSLGPVVAKENEQVQTVKMVNESVYLNYERYTLDTLLLIVKFLLHCIMFLVLPYLLIIG